MKALKILKDNRNNIDYLIQHKKLNKDEIEKYKNRFKYLNEAIAELENLQSRRCKTCKYYKPNNTTTCNGFEQYEECLRFVDSIHTIPCETFCCNKWEQ